MLVFEGWLSEDAWMALIEGRLSEGAGMLLFGGQSVAAAVDIHLVLITS